MWDRCARSSVDVAAEHQGVVATLKAIGALLEYCSEATLEVNADILWMFYKAVPMVTAIGYTTTALNTIGITSIQGKLDDWMNGSCMLQSFLMTLMFKYKVHPLL